MVYKLAQQVNKIEKHGFLVGIFSIIFLVLLRVIKKRFFPSPVLMQLFSDEAADTGSRVADAVAVTVRIVPRTAWAQ
jgi:hypothetical protein